MTGVGAAKVWIVVETKLQAGVVERGLPVGHDEQRHDRRNDPKYRYHDVVHPCPLNQKSVLKKRVKYIVPKNYSLYV